LFKAFYFGAEKQLGQGERIETMTKRLLVKVQTILIDDSSKGKK